MAQTKPAAAKVDAFMQQWDTDHDGTLSVDEVKKAADARFDALDGDHDKTLDRKELRGIVAGKVIGQCLQPRHGGGPEAAVDQLLDAIGLTGVRGTFGYRAAAGNRRRRAT